VSLQKDTETLNVDISLPSQMLSAEVKLPTACVPKSGAPARFVSGTQSHVTSVSGYTVNTTAGASSKRVSTTQNGFKVYRKRGTAQ
jgi:hypothetical protein